MKRESDTVIEALAWSQRRKVESHCANEELEFRVYDVSVTYCHVTNHLKIE